MALKYYLKLMASLYSQIDENKQMTYLKAAMGTKYLMFLKEILEHDFDRLNEPENINLHLPSAHMTNVFFGQIFEILRNFFRIFYIKQQISDTILSPRSCGQALPLKIHGTILSQVHHNFPIFYQHFY